MRDRGRKVVVTGLGLCTALGLGVEESWQKALAGVSGLSAPDLDELAGSPLRAVGQVSAADWQRLQAEFPEECSAPGERRTLFALWAAREALRDAGLESSSGLRGEVALGSGLGVHRLEDAARFLDQAGQFDARALGSGFSRLHGTSLARHPADRTAARVARRFGLRGSCLNVNTACASASHAAAMALGHLRRGEADLALVGGADSMLHPVGMVFFVLLGAASVANVPPAEACRPFDRKRGGLVMGEGAGFVVLETEERARARGARTYAELAGAATSMDGYQPTAPHPEGRGAAAAMRGAVEDAGISLTDISYINTHGTGTKLNDIAETRAIRTVFGPHADRLVINSSKPLFGHLLAAAGAPELVLTVLSVARDRVHPTRNRTNPDPACDLDCAADGVRSLTVTAALSNSFGFGNQNACLVVRKAAAG